MIQTANLGYPRIGLKRELKTALEKYWKAEIDQDAFISTGNQIQLHNWDTQKILGVDVIPSNDFSYYDHVLDSAIMVGAIPDRFVIPDLTDYYPQYFAMARGFQSRQDKMIPALEMTKWFNTNYHYLVPEISPTTFFQLNSKKLVYSYQLAEENGFKTRPVILGPVSFLLLSKTALEGFHPLEKLDDLLSIYSELFANLQQIGADWTQVDEPYLGCDLTPQMKQAYYKFFEHIQDNTKRPRLMLTTYFSDISTNMDVIHHSPCEGLHIDVHNNKRISMISSHLTGIDTLSLGIIDGRNVWRADLFGISDRVKEIISLQSTPNVLLSPTCSLMHVPQDVDLEVNLDERIKPWLSFANQKLLELTALKESINSNYSVNEQLLMNERILKDRREYLIASNGLPSEDVHKQEDDFSKNQRQAVFSERKKIQRKILNLPLLPTTTIGSFPQTPEIRKSRAKYSKGELSRSEYEKFIKDHIQQTIKIQEELGLDVLVHGEFERNDMVQFFAEKMDGFLFTQHGWVQSFGSRYVRPPIIFSSIKRPEPMTVRWSEYAQSLTEKPVKGMLTGPVTILQWSFVRDDQPRSITCREIAQVIRQEVEDLERSSISIIQIDEPALREGLPLQKIDWQDYLSWAVGCFKIASSGVKNETQIHTHMCYAEFNDIISSILEMDADVISMEASRSGMQLLSAFKEFNYANDIGPGVYDIHSPNIPSPEQITTLIERALEVIPSSNLWVNPDCGLKTRNWDEVIPSLKAMVQAAIIVRDQINNSNLISK